MNATQIAVVTDMILEKFWYLRIEEIKSCFREKMFSAKIYDRLDGNIILGWLREYDLERDKLMEQINIDEKNLIDNSTPESTEQGITYEEYLEDIRKKVKEGDEGAEEQLEIAMKFRINVDIDKDRDDAFKRWYQEEYLPNKCKK